MKKKQTFLYFFSPFSIWSHRLTVNDEPMPPPFLSCCPPSIPCLLQVLVGVDGAD